MRCPTPCDRELQRRRLTLPGAVGLVLTGAWILGGCMYSFSGGGGLPEHIETVAVPPVANESTRVELTDLLYQRLLEMVRGEFGKQLAAEDQADAIVRATITSYDDQALNIQAQEGRGANVFQRRVSIRARVEIYDVARDSIIWQSSSAGGSGEYAPATETDATGQELAIRNLIEQIVNGAQSQW